MNQVQEFMVPLYRLELVREKEIPYRSVTKAAAAAEVFHTMLDSAHVEKLALIHCNSGGDLIGAEIAAIGSLEMVGTTMADLFKGAVKNNAAQVWLAHNHVDGRVQASMPDYKFTMMAMDAAHLLEIHLNDHLVIGPGAHYSIFEHRKELAEQFRAHELGQLRKSLLGFLPVPGPGKF